MEKNTKNKSHNTNKPSITDWIQAITAMVGTIFAIVGLIIAWQTFTKNDNELQNQIDTLGLIARESIKHNEHLQRQIDLTIAELKPELSIKIGTNDGKVLQAFITNSGNTAIIKKIIFNKNNNLKLITPVDFVGEGKEIEIFFEITNHENPILDITINYVDIDQKEDSKRIKIEGAKNIFEPTPVLELN